MDMNWLETILYGLAAGLCEFLPVSSQAHQSILLYLFGQDGAHPLLGLLVHLGSLAALIVATRAQLTRLYREYSLMKVPKRRRKRFPDTLCLMDVSVLKTASIPLVLGFVVYFFTSRWSSRLYLIALLLLLNAVILHVPMYLPVGNKDARSMSRLDSLLIGLGGAFAVLPGVSRVGTSFSVASARGADLQQAYKWSLLLSVPAIVILSTFDVFFLISGGFDGLGFVFVLQCIVAAGFAYLGAHAAIALMRSLVQRTGLHGFSYYCLGAALFAFILYLI